MAKNKLEPIIAHVRESPRSISQSIQFRISTTSIRLRTHDGAEIAIEHLGQWYTFWLASRQSISGTDEVHYGAGIDAAELQQGHIAGANLLA